MERGIWYANVVKVILTSSIAVFCLIFLVHGFVEESLRIAIRNSARFSALVFVLAFSASALHRMFRNSFTFWLRMNRRHLGISFALLFLIHFLFLVVLQSCYHPVFNRAAWISLVGGGMAYVFAFFMFLTSFPSFSKKVSPKQWKVLHTVGGWWIWFIFIRSYAKRAFDMEGMLAFAPLFLLFVGLGLLRIADLFLRKKP